MSAGADEPLAAFDTAPDALLRHLVANGALFPELLAARADLAAWRETDRVRAVLAETAPLLRDLDAIPTTSYSRYRAFARTGAREPYETPYYRKREQLHAAALHLLLGHETYHDAVHDYLWSICEETTWVVPAHARVIDLMAAETAFGLAEIVGLLGPALDAEVRYRVREEIARRVFTPFLHSAYDLRWFNGSDNWNGVCAGAIGGALLYLESDPARLASGLALVLESLRTFVATSFADDGSTTEGVGYWNYGLTYVIIFAELLRGRTAGAIDLLAAPRLRRIAAFPPAMLLTAGHFASFADASETIAFNPGLLARFADRTSETELLSILGPNSQIQPAGSSGLSRTLRDLLWWDGDQHATSALGDALLPDNGLARLTASTGTGAPIALAIKAGHNDEHHNHNDVGSFILHIAGETFLTDPGPGHYARDYFNERRYESPFANSGGHSVPVIGGQLQGTGRAFCGQLQVAAGVIASAKSATVDFASAYPVATLTTARRTIILATPNAAGTIATLHDQFAFSDEGESIDEVLISWLPISIADATARLTGERHELLLTIEEPADAQFTLDTVATRAETQGAEPRPLRRLRFTLPRAASSLARVRFALRSLYTQHDDTRGE
jgi:hypothetical protein